MKFTLDANILINLERRYPRDFFASLWEAIEEGVITRQVCVCEVVYEELGRGEGELATWVKGVPHFICPISGDELALVADISRKHPEWVQGQKNYGDPFLIAHAKIDGLIIVTEEKSKGPGAADRNQKVPNIADEYGVACVDFFAFLRHQGWKF
ncbi:MAG: DUF4411 family protein [Actinomycetaceae bacterium]|nr:DUF4411 family protein [Actinomycetaceae bacterium]